jgi:hypothetical protein
LPNQVFIEGFSDRDKRIAEISPLERERA